MDIRIGIQRAALDNAESVHPSVVVVLFVVCLLDYVYYAFNTLCADPMRVSS